MVSALNRMLWRDLWHLRGQVIAAALVVACGVATLLATQGTYQSLVQARDAYYASHRFADVFAQLKRAPRAVAAQVAALPGVQQVQARVVLPVSLDVPGLAEPATGLVVSLPGSQRPVLNDLQRVQGRWIEPGSADEVLVSDVFARANGLRPGSTLGVLLQGRWRSLRVVGTALSPEFIYEVGPGMIFPDNRRYGVLWMDETAVAAAADLQGAFNDLAVKLAPGTTAVAVTRSIDALLQRYGGLSAQPRDRQVSHRFLTDELGELAVMTTVLPALFLLVAAFLLYVVLSRLVATQRAQIGLLKAFGQADVRIGLHYLGFALVTAALGTALGVPVGSLLGRSFVALYREYFHFPQLAWQLPPGLLALAVGVSAAAAAAGALVAVRAAVRLAPAEAMRPPAPALFRQGVLGSHWLGGLSASLRMILRHLLRTPAKAALSVVGMAAAVALMVLGRFSLDAANHLMSVQFGQVQRDDVTLVYAHPVDAAADLAVARLPGVLQVEGFRSVPVWLRHGQFSRRVEILGVPAGHQLRQLVGSDLKPVSVPPEGLVLGSKLAQLLAVQPGATLEVEVLEGARIEQRLPVTRTVDEMLGLGAYMDARALGRLLQSADSRSGAWLRVQADRSDDLFAELKRLPVVAGVVVRSAMLQGLRDAMDRSFFFFSVVLVLFAGVIIVGVVYNSARVALAERGHELASLAVLGFSRREVAQLLLGEQALLLLTAIPAGLLLGYGLCAALVPLFDRELFRLPLVLAPASWVYPALAALLAGVLSGLLVLRRIQRLDLVAVLKTRE